MSNATKRWGRAGIASMATTALVASGLTAFAGAASASEPVDFERIAGDNRYETSVEAAEAFGPTTNALLASGEQGHYVDALSGNFLAGVRTAPILLTREDRLPEPVKAHLESSTIDTITILGGELAVSAAVEAELEAMGITVNRLEGQNRYLTNEAIIDAGAAEAADTALIATGENFPDALGAGPVSYAGKMPVGLTKLNDIPDFVVQSLLDAGVSKALVLGGELAVSEEVVEELESKGIDVIDRLDGRNRSLTSIEVANWAIANLDFSDSEVDFASGRELSEGIDALSGGPVSGKEGVPMLITVDENRAPQLVDYLEANAERIDEGDIYGGPLAITTALEQELEEAAEAEVTSNQDYTVTPAGAQNVEEGTVQQFSVSGIDADTVEIRLFACEDVTVDDNGVATFDGTNPGGTGNVADNDYAGSATVTVVNGVNSGDTTDVDSADGTVTFTVENAAAPDCYVPVIFADADNDGQLDLAANSEPSEEFGLGAETTVIAAEFDADSVTPGNQSGTIPAGTVDFVDLANDVFSTEDGSFFYDSNDEFQVDSDQDGDYDTVTLAQFESVLSVDDTLDGQFYRTDAAGQSVFQITDLGPDPVDAVATETATGTNQGKEGIQLTFDESLTTTVVSYDVYRALATQPTVTGQDVTCTENLANYTKIGAVEDTNPADDELEFFDGTAQAPATTGGEDPSYCYAVVAVDETGDVSDPTFGGPFQAAEATADSGAPMFQSATATSGATDTVVLDYDEAIDGGTVDGTEFEVRVISGSVTTNVTADIVTAVASGSETVTITLPGTAFDAGDTVRVDVVQGEDGDTVGDDDTPQVFQPADDAVIDVAE